MTAGMAFEGLNNAGIENSDLLVILNDNNMAIDPSVGAMKEYLLDITTSKTYNRVRNDIWNLLGVLNKINPNTRQYFQKLENGIKSIVLKARSTILGILDQFRQSFIPQPESLLLRQSPPENLPKYQSKTIRVFHSRL